jgi:hypothetical protein
MSLRKHYTSAVIPKLQKELEEECERTSSSRQGRREYGYRFSRDWWSKGLLTL